MSKRKTKYTLRPDGNIVLTKVINGKRKYFYGRSDEDVEQKLADYIVSLSAAPEKKVRTFEEVADAWWEKKEPKLSPNSINSYVARLKEVKGEFGKARVDEITPQQILRYLDRAAAQGYAQKGITNRRSIIKSILDNALAVGEIPVNPCTSLPIVKGTAPKKRRPASDPDIEKIEAVKMSSLIARMYYFMEYTGCRVGEAIVLQQKDLDIEHHKATISKDIAFRGQKPEVKDRPKTEAGEREIDLYDNVIEILPHYDDAETYIFFPDGLPTKYQYEKALRDFRKENGITATAHQLRHTYAGIMHSAEIDVKDAQARLGHANISMTQDIYTEIEKQHSSKVRDKANTYIMEQRLNRSSTTCPHCGSKYTQASDGHAFTFCPDCGKKLML